jgi:hypothetical protein
MPEKITLEQVLELVSFKKEPEGNWKVLTVYGDVNGDVNGDVRGDVSGDVYGIVCGDVCGSVCGDVCGDVYGDVRGDVDGEVIGKIKCRSWESVKTPKEKLDRLILKSGDQELIEAFNQLHQNN